MNKHRTFSIRPDAISTILYLLLLGIGVMEVYATARIPGESFTLWNTDTLYGKQLIWALMSILIIPLVFLFSHTFYERFAGIFYLTALLAVAGLFVFGTTVKGQTNWYRIGSFSLQPSEFVKPAVSLALAKLMSDPLFDIQKTKDFLSSILVVIIPVILIALQPDIGTALIFSAFVFVFLREGMSLWYFWGMIVFLILFVATIKFGAVITWSVILAGTAVFSYLNYRKRPIFFHKNGVVLAFFVLFVTASVGSSHFIYHKVLKKHHTDRLSLWLRMEKNPRKLRYLKRDYGYNNDQSVKAISLGGWMGKGYLKGERTRGKFVPEQHTDYIFSAIGEEFGFTGALAVILIFTGLILRIIWLAEHQESRFKRIYGYSVASVLFIHFVFNIGMVTDLLPTIGIPLPFISYGGSSLWSFTLMLFIFLKLDADKKYQL